MANNDKFQLYKSAFDLTVYIVFKSYKSWYHAAKMLFDIDMQCEKPLSNGINFLGYVQHIFYRLVRRRVIDNFRNKLKWWAVGEPVEPSLISTSLNDRETCQVTSLQKDNKISVLSKLRSVLTSYLAYSSKANSFRILIKTLHTHQWLKNFFRIFRTKAAFSEEITTTYKLKIAEFF